MREISVLPASQGVSGVNFFGRGLGTPEGDFDAEWISPRAFFG